MNEDEELYIELEDEEDEERCRDCGGFNDGQGSEPGYCSTCRPEDDES